MTARVAPTAREIAHVIGSIEPGGLYGDEFADGAFGTMREEVARRVGPRRPLWVTPVNAAVGTLAGVTIARALGVPWWAVVAGHTALLAFLAFVVVGLMAGAGRAIADRARLALVVQLARERLRGQDAEGARAMLEFLPEDGCPCDGCLALRHGFTPSTERLARRRRRP